MAKISFSNFLVFVCFVFACLLVNNVNAHLPSCLDVAAPALVPTNHKVAVGGASQTIQGRIVRFTGCCEINAVAFLKSSPTHTFVVGVAPWDTTLRKTTGPFTTFYTGVDSSSGTSVVSVNPTSTVILPPGDYIFAIWANPLGAATFNLYYETRYSAGHTGRANCNFPGQFFPAVGTCFTTACYQLLKLNVSATLSSTCPQSISPTAPPPPPPTTPPPSVISISLPPLPTQSVTVVPSTPPPPPPPPPPPSTIPSVSSVRPTAPPRTSSPPPPPPPPPSRNPPPPPPRPPPPPPHHHHSESTDESDQEPSHHHRPPPPPPRRPPPPPPRRPPPPPPRRGHSERSEHHGRH